jgi:hypothetical protein
MFQEEDVPPNAVFSNIDRDYVRDLFFRELIHAVDVQEDSYDEDLGEYEEELGIEDEDDPIPESNVYRDFIMNTPAYEWLITSLEREAKLTRATPDLMEDVRKNILDALPSSHKVSRKVSSQEYRARFELDWDPLSFVKEQEYTESPGEALEKAITLTGTGTDAQALTAGEYLSQTWPATGNHMMQLVAHTIEDTSALSSTGEYIGFISTEASFLTWICQQNYLMELKYQLSLKGVPL